LTESREKRLKTIRDLIARAASTEFEAERDACLAKADELQTRFQVEEWELAHLNDTSVAGRTPIRRDMEMMWRNGIDFDMRGSLRRMFLDCADHCRCVVAESKDDYVANRIPVFGLEADLDYLDLLYTNLFMQMVSKMKPEYDPSKSLGYNVYQAKEARMKYKDIAIWCGHPEWIKVVPRYNARKGCTEDKVELNGIMIREMKKYAKENNLTVHKEVSLRYYFIDYCSGFVSSVGAKLMQMRQDQGQDEGSMAIALRDMKQVSLELMWAEFPDMAPHPPDCDCDPCHAARCTDPDCKREICKRRRKPVPKSHYRNVSMAGAARGRNAGREAKIIGREPNLGGRRKELG